MSISTNPHHTFLVAVACLLFSAAAQAQSAPATAPAQPRDNPQDCCVRLTAAVQKSPPRIALSWQALPGCTGFTVSRAAKDGNEWAKLADLPASAKGFVDSNVSVGVAYEYQVIATVPTEARQGTDANVQQRSGVPRLPQERKDQRDGAILSGIELPLADSRGKVLLLIEANQAQPLAREIDRLGQDLVGDGWTVTRQEVPADEQPPAVRARVRKEYDADPNGLAAVLILGHLAVPRSGDYAPDGHPERRGAQPADVYYADIDGKYTDVMTFAYPDANIRTLPECRNVPGDGRFDQSAIPGTTILQLGRADFADLPAFAPLTETDLLRQYLDKDHNWRQKAFTLAPRFLIRDHVGGSRRGIAPAAVAWANGTALFGPDHIVNAANITTFPQLLGSDDYVWASAFAGSGRTNIGGIVTTEQLTKTDLHAAFYLAYGSYFIDWACKDNVMRSLLATKTYSLAASWSGPLWPVDCHAMAMGETLGYCLRWSQSPPAAGPRLGGYVHMALMGDPTLRMHIVAPPTDAQAAAAGKAMKLSWKASADKDVLGYHVYRADKAGGTYARLTPSPVKDLAWTDAASAAGATYMIRAIRLQTSPSGSYFNASQGAFAGAN